MPNDVINKEVLEVKKVETKPIVNLEIRKKIFEIEDKIRKMPGSLIGDSPEYLAVCPLTHNFADGMYIRKIFLPKGIIFVTKIHKKDHPYFILQGDVSVLTENGIIRIKAPHNDITKSGTKRIIYTHEDTVWITVHRTDEKDIDKIEEEVIVKSYDEFENDIINLITNKEE